MTQTTTAAPTKLDRLAHAFSVAGSVAHEFGTLLLRQRNEELAGQLGAAHNHAAYLSQLVEHAYHLGRVHGHLGDIPVPENIPAAAADSLERLATDHYGTAAADVDEPEHQGDEPGADVGMQAAAPLECDHGLSTPVAGLCDHDEVAELGTAAAAQ